MGLCLFPLVPCITGRRNGSCPVWMSSVSRSPGRQAAPSISPHSPWMMPPEQTLRTSHGNKASGVLLSNEARPDSVDSLFKRANSIPSRYSWGRTSPAKHKKHQRKGSVKCPHWKVMGGTVHLKFKLDVGEFQVLVSWMYSIPAP